MVNGFSQNLDHWGLRWPCGRVWGPGRRLSHDYGWWGAEPRRPLPSTLHPRHPSPPSCQVHRPLQDSEDCSCQGHISLKSRPAPSSHPTHSRHGSHASADPDVTQSLLISQLPRNHQVLLPLGGISRKSEHCTVMRFHKQISHTSQNRTHSTVPLLDASPGLRTCGTLSCTGAMRTRQAMGKMFSSPCKVLLQSHLHPRSAHMADGGRVHPSDPHPDRGTQGPSRPKKLGAWARNVVQVYALPQPLAP